MKYIYISLDEKEAKISPSNFEKMTNSNWTKSDQIGPELDQIELNWSLIGPQIQKL